MVKRTGLFRALAHRPFALLWSGQTVSRVGDFIYQVALAWWVLEKTGSAAVMASVQIFAFAPMLVFLLIGGVAVDRLPRVGVMLASDLIRGAVVIAVSALAYSRLLEVWHVYLASLLFGLVDAFFQPAYAAMVPEVAPAADLPSANALSSMGVQLGRIGGPALGAALVGVAGPAGAFACNGLSFFVSAACLLPLLGRTAPPPSAPDQPRSSVFADVREGFATVAGSPVLWISIIIFALSNVTLAGPYSVALPFLVKDNLHAGVGTLGLLYALFPVGYLITGVWQGRAASLHRRGLTMCGGLMIAGLMMLVLGLSLPLVMLCAAAVVNGAALEVGSLIWTNLLQARVPPDQLGRVSSIDMLGSYVLLPVGFAVAGWATVVLGAPLVCVVGGGCTALLALLGLSHSAIRGLD